MNLPSGGSVHHLQPRCELFLSIYLYIEDRGTQAHIFSLKFDRIGVLQAPMQCLCTPVGGTRVSISEEFFLIFLIFFSLVVSHALQIEDNYLQNTKLSVFCFGNNNLESFLPILSLDRWLRGQGPE